MGRIKRGYTRVIPPDELKRDYRLFAIACEGHSRKYDANHIFVGVERVGEIYREQRRQQHK